MTEAVVDAARIIRAIEYITIATADADGQPWNTAVYSAFDSDLRFYWASDRNAVHSTNIARNSNVFLVIYDSTVPAGTGEGVFVKAEAATLENTGEISHALELLDRRAGEGSNTPEQFLGDMPRRVFAAQASQVWINGDGEKDGHFIDIRIDVPVGELRKALS